MSLTAKDVAEIMRLLEESSFDSLSLEMDGVKINLRRNSAAPVRQGPENGAGPASPASTTAAQVNPKAQPSTFPPRLGQRYRPPSEPGLYEVPSPLLGIFHRAPKPGELPLIEVGAQVEEDTVIGIIEVMKLMNSVRAGMKGRVVEILVENGEAVEYGQILLRVRAEV